MKRAFVASLFGAAFVAASCFAAGGTKDGSRIVVEGKKTIALADGGQIIVGSGGRTYHTDARGKRVRMRDGVVMEGKDGARYAHKNDVIWKQITEKGTLAPNR